MIKEIESFLLRTKTSKLERSKTEWTYDTSLKNHKSHGMGEYGLMFAVSYKN